MMYAMLLNFSFLRRNAKTNEQTVFGDSLKMTHCRLLLAGRLTKHVNNKILVQDVALYNNERVHAISAAC